MAPDPSDVSVFDPSAVFSGRVTGHDLVVHGSFEGTVELTGRLRAPSGSRLRVNVRAADVQIDGDFDGEVRAGSLLLGETARARGTFLVDRLVVHEGAVLEGSVNLPAPKDQAPREPGPGSDEELEAPVPALSG